MTEARPQDDVVRVAESYYDSSDADNFYYHVWGGEDIHIGLYAPERQAVAAASRATVELMANKLSDLGPGTRVLDLGAGYGGAARHLAHAAGCHVCCLNLSETQNARNRAQTAEQGLAGRVSVVHGNFEQLPFEPNSFDVVWSQDAILHSGNRAGVLAEVARVIRPGGQFVFTDPMQADDCPAGVLQPVLDRIHLATLGSFAFYRQELGKLGFEELEVVDLSEQLPKHYSRVRAELSARYDEVTQVSSKAYVDRMLEGLGAWIRAGESGHLKWGILLFRAPSAASG